jgi:cytochrome b6-f complex iron-sulfur subunit
MTANQEHLPLLSTPDEIAMENNPRSGRREFVCRLGAACTALATVRCGGGGGSPTGPLTPPDPSPTLLRLPLPAVGETVAALSGNVSLAITRVSTTSVVAVSRICTHEGCTVLLPEAPGQTLDCPCHGSRFTTAGAVVMGPAARALQMFSARIEGAEVVVTIS